MDIIIMTLIAIASITLWLWLGWKGSKRMHTYFIDKYSDALGSARAWTRGDEIMARIFMLAGPANLFASFFFDSARLNQASSDKPTTTWFSE